MIGFISKSRDMKLSIALAIWCDRSPAYRFNDLYVITGGALIKHSQLSPHIGRLPTAVSGIGKLFQAILEKIKFMLVPDKGKK